MAVGQERNQQTVEHRALPDDDLADFLLNLSEEAAFFRNPRYRRLGVVGPQVHRRLSGSGAHEETG